jgi:hypothetical protein
MTELQVDDLSFCESANDSQVQGGLLYPSNTNGPVVSSLNYSRVYDLDNMMGDSFRKGLSDKDLDKLGKLGYRMVSKDGKKVVGGYSGKKGDTNVAAAFARVKS